MSTSYTDLGQRLFDLLAGLDISSALPPALPGDPAPTWASMFNRPPKSDEVFYPAFAVMPVRDTQTLEDTATDTDFVVFAIYIYVNYWEATDSEDQIRALVDLVRTALRAERLSDVPLGGACYALGFTGAWGGDETQSERFYRLEVTARVSESTP